MLFALAVQALDFTVGNLKYSTNTDGISVSVSSSETAHLVGQLEIPASVTDGAKSYAVTSISQNAFNFAAILLTSHSFLCYFDRR